MKNKFTKIKEYPVLEKVRVIDLKGYTESHPYENGIASYFLQTDKGQPYGFPKPISKIIHISNIEIDHEIS